MKKISENLKNIKEKIVRAAAKSGRDPQSIKLIAVTKTASIDQIKDAFSAGQLDFGENRIQDAKEKIEYFTNYPNIKWHMIGHLQSNKVKAAIDLFQFIHSVDSFSLACEINRRASQKGNVMPVFIEVNISEEKSKYGIFKEELPKLIEDIKNLPSINLLGLMAMAPFTENPANSRPYFRNLADIGKIYGLKELSMGTSQDFEVAIEEGATIIRVGREMFGESSK